MKLKDLFYSQVLEEGGVARHTGEQMGGVPSILISVWGRIHSKRNEGISLEFLNVTSSLSEENKKGNLWQVPALPHWSPWSPE